jgi:hypothetical protein
VSLLHHGGVQLPSHDVCCHQFVAAPRAEHLPSQRMHTRANHGLHARAAHHESRCWSVAQSFVEQVPGEHLGERGPTDVPRTHEEEPELSIFLAPMPSHGHMMPRPTETRITP